ncbi:Avr9/Cf-9 rapidly elicited protein 75 [Melia azedarach]|uniref:Avr9/Cf-9 rapidly elicited protein 75 n=1 Tax=Melia azedarach TaxID=155640 RepID=A0ACC1WR16_MELAZ|nr:Avr9/Cf-9 rapidly elicited protein 75 [Melia azedarach]
MEINHTHFYIYTSTLDQTQTQENSKMANLMLRKSSKDVGGRSKADTRCKKHPKHKQSPGVCSICLGEKLFQLSSTSRSNTTTTTMGSYCSSSSPLSSYYSSSSASSCSSPLHLYRFTTEGKHSLSTLLFGSKNVLTKSRSLVFVPRMKNKEGDANGKKKKAGLFSKLFRPKSKKIEEGLVHSRTMREITVTG